MAPESRRFRSELAHSLLAATLRPRRRLLAIPYCTSPTSAKQLGQEPASSWNVSSHAASKELGELYT
eukprot:2901013-Prymnesium_polylepis.1